MDERDKPGSQGWSGLSQDERRRVFLAATRRPMHLLILLVGLGVFFTTFTLWIPPLTLATYAALIFFSSRDPLFHDRVLEGPHRPGLPGADEEPSPDRRARWLPRGETREKVEAALEVQRKTLAAIGESDDVTREVLSDAIPKLSALGNGLVDLAHRREKAESYVSELQKKQNHKDEAGELRDEIQSLRKEVHRADEELSGMLERLLTLRSRVIRVSLESGDHGREAASDLTRDLDDLNRRVEALGETLEPPRG